MTLALVAVAGEAVASLLEPWPLKIVLDYLLQAQALARLDDASGRVDRSRQARGSQCRGGRRRRDRHRGAASVVPQRHLTTSVGQWVMHDLRRTLYHHIHRLSLAEHDEKRTGDLIGRVTRDIDSIQDFVTSALLGIVTNALTLVGIIGVMLYLNWRFTLISLSVAPVLFLVVYAFTRRIKKASREVRKKGERPGLDGRRGLLVDSRRQSLCPRRLRRAPIRAPESGERRGGAAGQERQIEARAGRRHHRRDRDLSDALVRGAAGHRRATDRRCTGRLSALPGKDVQADARSVEDGGHGVQGQRGIRADPRGARDRRRSARPAARARGPRFKGAIEFDTSRSATAPIRSFSTTSAFKIEPGQVAAFVGPTGGGKTTIINLVARFYDPVSGTVSHRRHGHPAFTIRSLRDQISFVLQDTLLFHAPIWQNIAYGRPEATRAEIIRAAELANAHEFITEMPDGYDTMVGERGVTLVRRPAPAHRHRAGGDSRHADSHAGRTDVRAGRAIGAVGLRGARPADERQDVDRHRAPSARRSCTPT